MSQEDWEHIERYKQKIIDDETIMSPWSLEDVQQQAEDDGLLLSLNQQKRVLSLVSSKHDATIGINWDTISYWISEVYQQEEE